MTIAPTTTLLGQACAPVPPSCNLKTTKTDAARRKMGRERAGKGAMFVERIGGTYRMIGLYSVGIKILIVIGSYESMRTY
jgi:hypothetical protein